MNNSIDHLKECKCVERLAKEIASEEREIRKHKLMDTAYGISIVIAFGFVIAISLVGAFTRTH